MKKVFYEFFAGGGMAHAGLGKDWECLFANDLSEMKGAAYRANWGARGLYVQDVATVKPDQLPGQADLAWASFPCQDLSLAGNGAGLNGERSGTFWPFMRLMEALNRDGRKPRMIALENVYGAITSHDGRDFAAMVDALSGLGYRVGGLVIDAARFLPQSRPRLFIVAVDELIELPAGCVSEAPSNEWHPQAIRRAYARLDARSASNWVWWSMPSPGARKASFADLVEQEPQGVEWHSAPETERLLSMMSDVNRRKVDKATESKCLQVGTIYRRTREGQQRAEVRFDGVAGCLRTPGGGSSRQTIMIVQGKKIRSRLLSPREAARLMGLPDAYKLPAKYNDAYHLAGDGVVVPVVSHLAKHILGPVADAARHARTEQSQAVA